METGKRYWTWLLTAAKQGQQTLWWNRLSFIYVVLRRFFYFPPRQCCWRWSREIDTDVITVERNSVAKSIGKNNNLHCEQENNRFFSFFIWGLKEQFEKESISLLGSLSNKSTAIVENSRVPSCGFAYILIFFSILRALKDYRATVRCEKIKEKERSCD